MKFLPDVLSSIAKQTCRDFAILIIDNGSNDGTVEFARSNYPDVRILRNTHNLGFARAHNQGIELAFALWKSYPTSDSSNHFVLVTNPDIILEPDFLECLLSGVDTRSDAGSFGGKLLRAFDGRGEEADVPWKSDIIDSRGLLIRKNRSMQDRDSGVLDTEEFSNIEDVFGFSGALCLYRASALEDVKIGREYFDEDFFLYKEDVDLAWRLRLRGWNAVYNGAARAYHYRSLSEPMVVQSPKNIMKYIQTRKTRSPRSSIYSYRNHFLTILKNDYAVNFLFSFPRIAWYELRKLMFISLFEPRTLLAITMILVKVPNMIRKRILIMRGAKVGAREIREWFI